MICVATLHVSTRRYLNIMLDLICVANLSCGYHQLDYFLMKIATGENLGTANRP